jgi:hypothetical protein
VNSFDAFPAPESMQAIFQPVMIPGHDEEEDKARCQNQIAEHRPAEFMRNDGAKEAAGKNREPYRRKPRADASAIRFQTSRTAECMDKLLLTDWARSCWDGWFHNNADDTGSLR